MKLKKTLNEQRQQIENTASNIVDTTNKVTNTINESQKINNENIEKNSYITKYPQQTINTVQSILSDDIQLQKNIHFF